jgi:hypothetical protein
VNLLPVNENTFRSEEKEVTVGRRKLRNKELLNFRSSNIIGIDKSRK